jgi:hypothetical protein
MSSQSNSSTGLSHPEYDSLFAGHDARLDYSQVSQVWLGDNSGLNQAALPSPAVSASPARSSTGTSSSASVVPDEPLADDHAFPLPSDSSASDVNNEGMSLIRGAVVEIRGPSTSASHGFGAANNNNGEGNSIIRGAVVQVSQPSSSGYGSGDLRIRERGTRATVARATVAQVAGGSPHRTPRRTVVRVPQRLASQHRNFNAPQYYEIWRDSAVMSSFLNSREYSITFSLCFFFL